MVKADVGAVITADNGVALEIPVGVMAYDAEATITSLPDGTYDLHIAGDWNGLVGVTLPLDPGEDAIAHRLGDTWVLEGTDWGQGTVWVSSLSLFSKVKGRAPS